MRHKNPFLSPAEALSERRAAAIVENLHKRAKRNMTYFDGALGVHPREILLLMDWKHNVLYQRVRYHQLPDEFTDEERAYFEKKTILVDDRTMEVYELERNRFEYFEERIHRMDTIHLKKTREKFANPDRENNLEKINKGEPRVLELSGCADRIFRGDRVLFYAGAGISAGQIPTNHALAKRVGYKPHAVFDPFIRTLLHSPREIIRQGFISNLSECLIAHPDPSAAHRALKALVDCQDAALVTTNFDTYFQKCGIKPFNLWYDDMQPYWTPETIRQIDIVVVLGCSEDSLEFLKRYKQHNPEGSFIALNLNPVAYLGENDFFCQGDLQELLPELYRQVAEKKMAAYGGYTLRTAIPLNPEYHTHSHINRNRVFNKGTKRQVDRAGLESNDTRTSMRARR